jgi:membrane protein implicated in regulation of membrane protease activity
VYTHALGGFSAELTPSVVAAVRCEATVDTWNSINASRLAVEVAGWPLPNQRMKLSWRGGRLKGSDLSCLRPPHHAAYARFVDVTYLPTMDTIAKYSLADWIYGVAVSLIGAIVFAGLVLALRWLWRWLRSFSSQYRRDDQKNRIIKIFVYRRYLKAKNAISLSRGHFFVISHCLQLFILGALLVAMGLILSWVMSMQLPLFMFIGLAIWMFVEAVSWLDPRWSAKALENVDEQALSEAAAILSETVDEVRKQVTQPDA